MNTIYSRRKALQAGTGLLLTLGTGALPLKLLADEPYADPEAADRWLLPLLHALVVMEERGGDAAFV